MAVKYRSSPGKVHQQPLNAVEEETASLLLTMAAAFTELRMDQLPTDPLLHILSYLDFRDLMQYVSHTSTVQPGEEEENTPLISSYTSCRRKRRLEANR